MRTRGGDDISPYVGLAFAALNLIAVAAVGWAALRVQQTELDSEQLSGAGQATYWLARSLSKAESPEVIERELRRASRDDNIESCGVVGADGKYIAHTASEMVGHAAEELTWTGELSNNVKWAVHPTRTGVRVLSCRLPSPENPGEGELRVELRNQHRPWTQSDLFFWAGYVLLAVLSLYLLVYRMFRRAIRPLAVIRRQLEGCREPAIERLLALRLTDSHDQMSASWNRLIEFVAQMHEQIRHSKLVPDVSLAMDGYRSEQLTGILMQIPFGVMVMDRAGVISFANRAAAGMLSRSVEALEGAAAEEVFEESLRTTLLAVSRSRGNQSPTSRWTDHTFERPHGKITLRFWTVTSESGDDHILFIQDVTQAKEAEQARDQFLYHVTHELRTPLTNIRAYAETLSQGVIEDEQTLRECYNVIIGETQRLNRLVEDILNVSQMEVGSARLDVGEVQIERLIRTVVQDQQGSADAKNIDLALNLPAKMPQVRGDKERLAVVLTNLVGNAIKYTPEGGRVEVRCTNEHEKLRISVTDTGIGIKPEDQERVFDKFYRVDSAEVAAIPGTGLGLSIVKETVRLHGGSVFVTSTPGQGSTFTVVLPAIPVDDRGSGGKAAVSQTVEKS